MKQESKDLLLKDLCGRLPYGVKCKSQQAQDVKIGGELLIDINIFGRVNIGGHIKDICDIKPYLFPLSSMTEEQKEEYESLIYSKIEIHSERYDDVVVDGLDWLFDFYHKHHLDYRGLIPMGLANDATNLNIY